MSRVPVLKKPVNKCVDACFGYDVYGTYSYLNSDLLGVIKVYTILKGHSLSHDNTYRKYALEGLNRKAGKVISKNFKELNTQHICFTELGFVYFNLYKDEIENKGISWSLFEDKVKNEPGYKKYLMLKVRNYSKMYGGVDSVVVKTPDSPVLSIKELKDLSEKSFESLEKLCKEMARTSNYLIQTKGFIEGNDDIADYVLETHKKYFSSASVNDKELMKSVNRVKHDMNDALVVLGLIERLK